MNRKIFRIVIMSLICFGCSNSRNIKTNYTWHDSDNYLIRRTYSDAGYLEREQIFTKDTIPFGADIRYYVNGNIKMWRFFSYQRSDSPACVITFDSNSRFEKIYGQPIGVVVETRGYFLVTVVKPPNINSILVLDIFKHEKCINRLKYEITYNDTIGYIFIDSSRELNFKQDNKYILEYLILDENNKPIAKPKNAMQIEENGYMFVPAPDFTKIQYK